MTDQTKSKSTATAKAPSAADSKAAPKASAAPSNGEGLEGPLVFEKSKKKKKKKKYSSRYVKRASKFEDAGAKAIHRIVRGGEVGISKLRKDRDKSSRKRRDGAIRDALRNNARALSKAIGKASRAPADLADGLPRPRTLRRGMYLRYMPPIGRAMSRFRFPRPPGFF